MSNMGGSRAMAVLTVMLATGILLYNPLNIEISEGHQHDLKPFSSYEELLHYIEQSNTPYPYYGGELKVLLREETSIGADEKGTDHSETNIQVEGVDEMDTVKTDGKYIYLAEGNTVYIIRAYPWQNATVLSKIHVNGTIKGLFLNEEHLIILETEYESPPLKTFFWFTSSTVIEIYDISSKDTPKRISRIELEGSLFDARMVDDIVYIISTESLYALLKKNNESTTLTPPKVIVNGKEEKIPPSKIYHPPKPQESYVMTYITAVDVTKGSVTDTMSILAGAATTMYASLNNLYLACTDYKIYYYPLENDIKEKTILYRISMENGKIKYAAHGEVPGRILDQFSMDEHDNFFRIATTSGDPWSGNSINSVYILDMNLQIVGSVEGIAPGERIYAVRFSGEKAYVVTYRNIDPFFVLDISDPYHPYVMGELKLPGFSTYLHPYNDTRIIGIGRETMQISPEEGTTIQPREIITGLKISLFDTSNPENPIEISKEVIEGDSVTSPALWDHKALLFDKEKNILAIPVTIENFYIVNTAEREEIYSSISFNGVYVYSIDTDGIVYRGRIPHDDSWNSVKRILYIENVLYTISDEKIKMSDIHTLEPLGEINLDVYIIQGAGGPIKILHQS